MAHELGPVVKTIRLAEETTQVKLYQGLLSRRQAIRFESGETDIKAESFLTVLERLDMSYDEFLYRWRKQTGQTKTVTRQADILNTVREKLAAWTDADMTPGEVRAIQAFALHRSFFTVSEIETLMTIQVRLPADARNRINDKLARVLAEMADMPAVKRLRYRLFSNQAIMQLLDGNAQEGKKYLDQAQQFASERDADRLFYLENTMLIIALTADSITQAYQATEPFIQHLRGLGLPVEADAWVDNRRHALASAGKHPVWTPGELGAVARLFEVVPWQFKQDQAAYLREFPGLTDALAQGEKPLRAYRDVY
jgi:hypothetical protein